MKKPEVKKAFLFSRWDIPVILFWLVCAGCLFLTSEGSFGQTSAEKKLEITVKNEVFGVYSLDEDRTIEIGDKNTCRIEGGCVSMIYADCPDKACERSGSIQNPGESIVCLPNGVILKITGGDKGGLDAIVE